MNTRGTFGVKAEKGLSLIEVMIVLVLLGGIAVLGLPRIGSHKNELKATMRKLSVLGKQLQVNARLQYRTYRLAFDLSKKNPHSFWVESAQGYISESPNNEDFEEDEEDGEEQNSMATFQPDTSILKKPIELPKPLLFKDIEVTGGIIEEGKAYVHFFPQGIVEDVAIHLSDGEDLEWTIVYHSLTGKGHISSRYLSLRDLRQNN